MHKRQLGGKDGDVKGAVSDFLLRMPVARLFGLQVVEVAPGRVVVRFPFKAGLTYDGRIVQAGVVGALADFAGAAAAMTMLPAGYVIMTTGYEVHNIAPAAGEELIGVGEVIRPGIGYGLSRADVFATAQGTRSLCATALVTTRGVSAAEPA